MPGLEGTKLGRYLLKQRLGRGGMSEVYLAYDESMHREVALKIVSTSYADYIERFHREAEAIGRLHHDHILPAFDYGEQEPWHYLVMPYIEHGTLRDLLEKGRLTLEHVNELLQQIASGLQYAHDHGIIHRDIKPSNILLRDDHYAYLADFGLAKSLEGGSGLTQTGTLLGTPEYMAPELSEGPATTSSDMYALGILLYQMVTGRVPFSADTPLAVYWKQLREQPLPPSRLVYALPHAVEQVILRALEKDPRRRFQRAEDLASAFQHAVRTRQEPENMEALYNTTEMEEDFIDRRSGDTYGTQSRNSLQEDRLVLPGNPLDVPSAIPATRNRAGVRNRISSSFRRPNANRPQAKSSTDTSHQPPRTVFVDPESMPPLEALRQTAAYIAPGTTPATPTPRRASGRRKRQSSNPVIIAAFVGLGLLILITALISLSFYYYSSSGQPQKNATATAQANSAKATETSASATATTTATPQGTPQGQATAIVTGSPILKDTLGGNTNGRWTEDNTACIFTGGTYHVIVNRASYLQPCESNTLSYANVAMQVDASLLSGNDAGMILRVNGQQFYDFEINNQGQFFFRRHDINAGSTFVFLVNATSSAAIAPSGQKNTLLVIANGSDFKLYINGTFVGEIHDGNYASGQIGFVAGTLAQPATGEGSFANLNVFNVG